MKAGWEVATIGDICTLYTGGTPKRSEPRYFENGSVKWLVSGDIHRNEILDCEGRISQLGLENSNARYLPTNSVMIALNGQGKTRGTVAMLRTEATCNQSMVSIMPNDLSQLFPEYLFWNLRGRYEEIRKMTGDTGNDRRGLNMPLIRSIEVPIAPLDEQKRIVAVLDAAFEGLTRARTHVETNLQNARELFAALLLGFQSQGSDVWSESALEQLVTNDCTLSYGIVQPGDEVNEGLPIVRPVDLGEREIYLDGLKRIDPERSSGYARTVLQGGELLLCVRGTTGRIGIAAPELNGANVTRGIVPIRFDSKHILQRFGYYSFVSTPVQKQIEAATYGAALQQINIRDVRKIRFAYPDIEIQMKILEALDEAYDQAETLQAHYRSKIKDLDDLRQSLLQKAFAGELT